MHSVTKKRQLLGDEGGLRPPDPLGPLLSHILNTPLISTIGLPALTNSQSQMTAVGFLWLVHRVVC